MEIACRGGIDPGTKGFIVVLINREIQHKFPIPRIGTSYDNKVLKAIFISLQNNYGQNMHFVLENVSADPNWGTKGNWSMGGCMSMLEQVLVDHDIPFTKVSPRAWQKEMHEGVKPIMKPSKSGKTKQVDRKAMSVIAVNRLFPEVDLKVTEKGNKSKNDNDNLADALLMAEYSRRNY